MAPKVLIIHVEIRYYYKKEKKLKKFKKPIEATKGLDIRQHSDKQLKKYNLCGMIEHKGGATSGHYIANVRQFESFKTG
jgi:ubiquitin C-terminal hydrolase